jgi:hypothetical protein
VLTTPELRTDGSGCGLWPTATTDTASRDTRYAQGGLPLSAAVRKESKGILSPDWVEMLMGWPAGWSGLEPLDCLDWPAAHGAWPAPPGPQHDWEPPRVAVGVKDRVKRLKALGNGQVPQTAAMAWHILSREE